MPPRCGMDEQSIVRAVLERVLGIPLASAADAVGSGVDPVACRALRGGIDGRSYLASIGDRQYVVRLPNADTGHVLDLNVEAAVMRLAASAGLAPAVAGVDPDRGALVTQYLARAESWTAEAARKPANIDRAAALLLCLHEMPAQLPGLAVDRVAHTYLAGLELAVEHRAWAEEFAQLARQYRSSYRGSVLCHNDLAAANILDDGRLWLVDFEYAVCGPPILDLASLIVMNDYDSTQRRRLLEAYYRGSAVPFAPADLDRMVRMVRLMAFFWACANEQVAADAAPHARLRERLAATLR
jgi:thiamine kinase-like enzyme